MVVSPDDARELLERIFENPDDDDLRHVYGDVLLGENDPRGEFIALQFQRELRGELTDETRKREEELFRQHARQWTSPIDAAIFQEVRSGALGAVENRGPWDVVRFRRGFLDRCAIRYDAEHKGFIGHPLWSTVREIEYDDWEFLSHPILRSLRRLIALPSALSKLVQRPSKTGLPIEELMGPYSALRGWHCGVQLQVLSVWPFALQNPGITLSNVRTLRVHHDDDSARRVFPNPTELAWLRNMPLFAQLQDFGVITADSFRPKFKREQSTSKSIAEWIDLMCAPKSTTLALDRVRLAFGHRIETATVARMLVVLAIERLEEESADGAGAGAGGGGHVDLRLQFALPYRPYLEANETLQNIARVLMENEMISRLDRVRHFSIEYTGDDKAVRFDDFREIGEQLFAPLFHHVIYPTARTDSLWD